MTIWAGPLHERLSDRELEVLRRLAAGGTVSDIADDLSLSVNTVSTYRSRLVEKLGVRTTADLVRYALEHELSTNSPKESGYPKTDQRRSTGDKAAPSTHGRVQSRAAAATTSGDVTAYRQHQAGQQS